MTDLEKKAEIRIMELEKLATEWVSRYKHPNDALIVIDVTKETWEAQS